MLIDDLEALWTEIFDVRLLLDIAARHALEDHTLTADDRAAFALVDLLAERATSLDRRTSTDTERDAVRSAIEAINAHEGRIASYRLATADP